MSDAVVKIDESLLKEIEKLVKDSSKYEYSSKKQVVNLAILEFLKNHSLKESSKGGKK